jgi:hypothetical protein
MKLCGRRVLGALGGSYAGMRQQVKVLFSVQLLRTLVVLNANGQLCASLCLAAPTSKAYFIWVSSVVPEILARPTPAPVLCAFINLPCVMHSLLP